MCNIGVEVAVQVHDDSASDYNQLVEEQQRLHLSLEQWQRMGRARDQLILNLKKENEVLQAKCMYLSN